MSKKNEVQSLKDKMFSIVLVALLVGIGSGYGLAVLGKTDSSESMPDESYEHSANDEQDTHKGEMSTFVVPADNAPTVDLTVTEDAMHGGWNLKISTTNFTFTPEKVNTPNVPGEGHAHLYVDGEKVARIYGEYFYYGGSFDGTKTFRVSLNGNMHDEYTVDGRVIQAEKQVSHDDSI